MRDLGIKCDSYAVGQPPRYGQVAGVMLCSRSRERDFLSIVPLFRPNRQRPRRHRMTLPSNLAGAERRVSRGPIELGRIAPHGHRRRPSERVLRQHREQGRGVSVKLAPLAVETSVSVPPLPSDSPRAMARPRPCRGDAERDDCFTNRPARPRRPGGCRLRSGRPGGGVSNPVGRPRSRRPSN